MIRWLDNLYRNYPRLRQVVSLLTVNLMIIPISIVSNIFITRFLGSVAYGDFKFLFYVFSTAMVLFTFGFFQAGNRAIVLSNDAGKTREYYGSMILVLIGLYAILALSLVIYAFADNNISEKGLRSILLFIIPFSWIFMLMNYFEVLFQADNKITLLARSRLYPKILFFGAVLILYLFFKSFKGDRLTLMWILFIATHIAGFLYIMWKVNPSFRNTKLRLGEIWHFNKTYGFNVYIGTLFNVALSSFSGMLISYFGINNAGVGYYALAVTISDPLSFIPNVIATTHYKEFASRKKIEKRLTMVTIGVSLTAIFLCWLLVGPFVRIFYGPEFHPVIYLTFIVSIGIMFQGMADYFNRFLGAHGQGRSLRNSAMLTGIVILICNFTLIPFFGEKGAAFTKLFSGLAYFFTMIWFYRRLIRSLSSEEIQGKV